MGAWSLVGFEHDYKIVVDQNQNRKYNFSFIFNNSHVEFVTRQANGTTFVLAKITLKSLGASEETMSQYSITTREGDTHT